MKELHTKYKKPCKILILNVAIHFIVQVSLFSTEKVMLKKIESQTLGFNYLCEYVEILF